MNHTHQDQTKPQTLILILVALGLLIICLIAGIVIMRNTPTPAPDITDDTDTAEEAVAIDFTPEELATIKQEETQNAAWEAEYNTFENTKSELRTEADKLLQQTPPDTDAIDRNYLDKINSYLTNNDTSSSEALIFDERNYFLEHDMKKEALQYLSTKDYSPYPDFNQYPFYYSIVELATELGDTNLINQFQPLLDQTRPAWEKSMQEIELYDSTTNDNT